MALIDKYRNLLNRADTAIDKRASQLRQAYSQRIAPRQSLSKPMFQYSNATNTPQYKVLNSLARYQKAFSNPKRIEVLPNLDTKKARNIPLTIGAGLVEAAINEPRQQIADIGNAGYAIRTRKTGLRTGDVRNTANFNPQSNLFKLTNNVLDTIREDQNPLETVKLTSKYGDKRVLGYGKGKWSVPLTNVNLPEMGFSESNLAKMGKQVAGVAEPFAAYYGAMKPALVAGYTGLGGGVNATLNYALGNKDLKGNFIEGANLAGRDAVVSAGYLNKTNPIVDKLGAKGLKGLPVKSAVNVTQGLGQNAVTGTENSAESIILDALFPVFNELGSKSFGTADQALKAGQAKVKTALGMKLRNNKGLYTTAEKFAKGTRAYRKSGKYANGALLGVEPYQDEDGNWKVRFNKERALLGLGVGIGMTKNVTNGSVKDLADSLNRSEIGKSLDDATKQSVLEEAQRMLAGGIGDTGVVGNARYSANPDWYRDFYKQTGKAPSNEEFFDIALSRVKPQQGSDNIDDVMSKLLADEPAVTTQPDLTKDIGGEAKKFEDYLSSGELEPLLNEAKKYKNYATFEDAMMDKSVLFTDELSVLGETGKTLRDLYKLTRTAKPVVESQNIRSGFYQAQDEIKDNLNANSLKGKLEEIEKTLYKKAVPEGTALQSGAKDGTGLITTALRGAEAKLNLVLGGSLGADNIVARNFGRTMQGFLGELGKSDNYIRQLGKFQGGVQYASKLASDAQKYGAGLVNNDLKSLEKVWAVMDEELSGGKIKYDDLTPGEKQAHAFFTTLSDFINDTNYSNGMISKELWEKNRGGKYIARAYEPFELPPEMPDFLKQNRIKFDLNPFKQRTDVNEWKQEYSIKDPAYLMGKRLQQTLFNDELGRMFKWLGSDSRYVAQTARPGFVQLSDHKAYGDLAGKFIRKDILDDIGGLQFGHQIADQAYDILNWYNRNPVRQGYKQVFTVFNPVVRLGNKTSNVFFAWMAGIDPVTFVKNRGYAKNNIEKNGELYLRLIKDGVAGADASKKDITSFMAMLRKGGYDESSISKWVNSFKEGYGKEDDIAKVAAVRSYLDKGYSYEEATRRVYRGFQNYRTMGWMYDVGAKLPVFGNPFVRFKGELVRLAKNAAIEHPVRLASTVMAWKLFTDITSASSGETPQDRETREGRLGAPRIPFTDISLEVQTPWGAINGSRFLGIYANNSYEGNSAVDDASKYLPINVPSKKTLGSSPDIGPLLSVAVDTDFRGKSIKDPDANKYQGSLLTPLEQGKNVANYLRRSYTPTFLNSVEDTGRAFAGREDFYGRTKTPAQALANLAGFKVETFGAEQAQALREKNAYYDVKKTRDIQSNIKSIQKDLVEGKITEDQALARIQNQQKQLTGLDTDSYQVSAMERQKGDLPKDYDTFAVLYNDLMGDVNTYEKRRATLPYEPRNAAEEIDRQFDIADNERKLQSAKDMLETMRKERPFDVFKVELEENSSGSVEKRGDWAMEQIAKFAKEGKQKDIPLLLEVLWDNKVLTSGKNGSASYIARKYGVDTTTKTQIAKRNKGKKIKKKEIKLEKLERVAPKVSYKEADQVELDIPTFNPPTTLSGNSLGSFTPSANLEKIRRSSLTR